MKIAVTGKGGVGKTTISAALCHIYSLEGRKVLAVDADPDANLAGAFGLKPEDIAHLKPIAELSDLIEERTGAKPGSIGGMFKLNPRVDDIPEGFGYKFGNIILIIMGKAKTAASGCYCPESALLKRLLKHIIAERDEVVVVDMEAGIEHLTRGTSQSVDAFIVVVEPGQRSIQTASTVRRMAGELGVKNVYAVANKVRSESDVEFIKTGIGETQLIGVVSFNQQVIDADMKGIAPFDQKLISEVEEIKRKIESNR